MIIRTRLQRDCAHTSNTTVTSDNYHMEFDYLGFFIGWKFTQYITNQLPISGGYDKE